MTNKHDSDDDEEVKVEVPIVSSKEVKSFMTGLRKFFEQSQMDEEKCNIIFKAINTLDNSMDQIVAINVSQKQITDFFKYCMHICNLYLQYN